MKQFAPRFAVTIALVAIAIGLVGRFQPTLFLRVPNVGFILWAITGNHMPPHFDNLAWKEENFHKIVQPGDVIQATMAKSGTMWLAHVTQLLKNNGSDNYDKILDVWGQVEMMEYPGENIHLRIKRNENKRVSGQAMSWFSHMFPTNENYGLNATLHPKVKYIISARNGKEIIKSFVPFLNSHTDEFRKRWGGFPPPMDKVACLKMFALDNPDFIFEHIQAWWKLRYEPNVLLVHFADLTRDPRNQILRIAKFLEIDLTSKQLKNVVAKSSFEYMKARPEKWLLHGGREDDRYLMVKENSHINKGVTGGGEEFFTAEMNEMWERAVQKHWGNADPKMIHWAAYGGSY